MNKNGLSSPSKRGDINKVLNGASPEIRDVLKRAHDQGFQVTLTRNNHYKIQTPASWHTKETRFAPKTPSDRKSLQRVIRKLRHIGVDIPH